MIKIITKTALKSILLLALFAGSYYWFFLKPKLEIPNILLTVQKDISKNYYLILENRIAITELAKLNPEDKNMYLQKDEIITNIKSTNKKGLEELKKEINPKKIKSYPDQKTNFVNSELPEKLVKLSQQTQKIYGDQIKTIDKITDVDSKFGKVLSYNPETDINLGEPSTNKNKYLTLIEKAKEEITKIKPTVSSIEKVEARNLEKSLSNFDQILLSMEQSLNSGNYNQFENHKKEFISDYNLVKRDAYSIYLGVLKEPESIKTLTFQTNTINEYERLLRDIDEYSK